MKQLLLTLIFSFLFTSFHNVFAIQGIENPKVKWRFKTDGPIRGKAAIFQDQLFVGSSGGTLYALNKTDGSLIWKYHTTGALIGTPALTSTAVYISSRDNFVYAVDSESGDLKWTFEMDPILPDAHAGWEYFMASPVVSGDQLLIGSGDGYLYSLHAESGELKWKFQTGGRIRATSLVKNGIIYQPSNDGYVYVLNASDGKMLWKFETRGATYNPEDFSFDRSSIITQPLIVNNLLIFGSRDGNVYAINLTTHEEEWSFTYAPTWAMSVSISEGVVYAGWSTNNLFNAIDLATGKEIWKFQAGSHVYTTPLVLDSGVLIGSADGNIYKLNKRTGEKIWEYTIGQEVYSSLLYDSGTLYFGSDNGFYYALEDRPDAFMAVYQPEKIVGNAQFLVVDQQITPYLTERGFKRLDEKGLDQFIRDRISDQNPSVVVFSLPLIPHDILGSPPEHGLIRQYLETGGKILWMGDVPNYYMPDSTGNFSRDATDGTKLLGVEFKNPAEGGNYYGKATQIGLNWGLPAWLKVTNSTVEPGEGIIPLAYDEYSRIGLWIKKFNPRPGSGFISARTWAWNVPIHNSDLKLIHQLAVYELE